MPAMPALVPPEPPLQVVLVSPQIPPNTGNVARTCAVTASRLHLVEPLGFALDDASLRRAGLDYWASLAPAVYSSWPEFEDRVLRRARGRLHLFTGRATKCLFDAAFAPGDLLVFGSEQLGLPPALLAAHPEDCVAIPLVPGKRSLNLATAVGIGVYAALASIAGRTPRGAAPDAAG
jgi:tRNA (cytidine/uridine-2'-O-)-methyltransferase